MLLYDAKTFYKALQWIQNQAMFVYFSHQYLFKKSEEVMENKTSWSTDWVTEWIDFLSQATQTM